MLTKRDLLVATLTGCTVLSVIALAQSQKPQQPLMGSVAFDWKIIEVKPTKVGERRDFFQSPTATLDELECHVTTVNPGEEPHAPHQHPDEELMIVKDGTLEVLVNGEKKTVGPGSVVFQASNQMHGIRNVGKTPATYHIIRWKSPSMLKSK